MKAVPKLIFFWPEMPALPPPGQPVLVRVVTAQPRQTARLELRTVLRRILAAWSDLLPEQLPLHDMLRGPVWLGQLGGQAMNISLSYAEGEGWIGLLRAGLIGVDVMPVRLIPEADAVARLYLGPAAAAAIRQSADPAMAFSVAWTELEARIKCLSRELNEWQLAQACAANQCAIQYRLLPNHLVVSMATTSNF
jgi:4'-phosphopantetheinyl transferase